MTLGIRKGCTQYTRLSLLWDLSISTIILGVGIFLYYYELPNLFPFLLHVNWLNQQKKEYLSFNQSLFIVALGRWSGSDFEFAHSLSSFTQTSEAPILSLGFYHLIALAFVYYPDYSYIKWDALKILRNYNQAYVQC